MAKKRVNTRSITTKVDLNGNISEVQQVKSYSFDNEDNYIKVYLNEIETLINLPIGLKPVIYELIKETEYGNRIKINSDLKRQIAKNLGKTTNTINQYITALNKNNILIRYGCGTYYLNPYLYGKGKWKDIVFLREKLQEFKTCQG